MCAAIVSAREGLRVVVVEPSRWLGGMTGGGLSHIDWGRQEAVGGTTRGILKQGYNDPEFRRTFAALLEKYGVTVVFEHRVQAVDCREATINSIVLEEAPPDRLGCPVAEPTLSEALQVNAQVFVDCSYEGDLMARAGVSYTFGREARETYGESLAGVQVATAFVGSTASSPISCRWMLPMTTTRGCSRSTVAASGTASTCSSAGGCGKPAGCRHPPW